MSKKSIAVAMSGGVDSSIAGAILKQRGMEAIAKIRYHHPGAHCNLIPDERGKVIIEFKEPQRAVAPGQAVVFYIGETVLGGGVIKN